MVKFPISSLLSDVEAVVVVEATEETAAAEEEEEEEEEEEDGKHADIAATELFDKVVGTAITPPTPPSSPEEAVQDEDFAALIDSGSGSLPVSRYWLTAIRSSLQIKLAISLTSAPDMSRIHCSRAAAADSGGDLCQCRRTCLTSSVLSSGLRAFSLIDCNACSTPSMNELCVSGLHVDEYHTWMMWSIGEFAESIMLMTSVLATTTGHASHPTHLR